MISTTLRTIGLVLVLSTIAWTSCASEDSNQSETTEATAAQTQVTYTNIDVDRFDELHGDKQYVTLDVRTPGEIAEGKIGSAIEMDFYGDNFDTEMLKLDKSKHYLVYCAAGGRSSEAAEKMINAGFQHVYNLEGGYTAWSEKHDN